MSAEFTGSLLTTPLINFHRARGARLVPFAGWEMPVQYPTGIIAEHRHCRTAAALFDVAHMGLVRLRGPGVIAALESLVPAELELLTDHQAKLAVFTDANGGVLDDLIVTRIAQDHLLLVVNASRRDHDLAHLRGGLPPTISVEPLADLALIALQGPAALAVLARLIPDCGRLPFMGHGQFVIGGAFPGAGALVDVWRSGYTGEDGFELAVPVAVAAAFAERLCQEPEVAPAGLGARDSLRLEAGLCLYGHELSPTISPIEAGLAWTIGKRRRSVGGYPGHDLIARQLSDGAPRKRVGLIVEGRSIAREGVTVLLPRGSANITAAEAAQAAKGIGIVTSGTFSPVLERPIALALVAREHAAVGTTLQIDLRGRMTRATVVSLPFVPHQYVRA